MSAETRLWQYRRGEARIFESRKEIPDGEGWQDLPVKEAQNGTSTDNPSQQARVAADESANASGVEGAKGDGARQNRRKSRRQSARRQTGEHGCQA